MSFFTTSRTLGTSGAEVVEVVVVVVIVDVVVVVVVVLGAGLGSNATTGLGLFCRAFLQENVELNKMSSTKTEICLLHSILVKVLMILN